MMGTRLHDTSPTDKHWARLRTEVIARADSARTARETGDWTTAHRRHTDNQQWLAAKAAAYGWLGTDLVGDDGAQAAWEIACHASADRIRDWIGLVRRARRAGTVPGWQLAHLCDLLRIANRERQRYGTQHITDTDGTERLYPLEVPLATNQYRVDEMGMEPLSEAELAAAWDVIDPRWHQR